MKPSFDQAAADLFTSEGAPAAAQYPLVPECVTTPGTNSEFHPRPMPSLLLACPSSDGAQRRYRKPLWRAFGTGSS
jgi:hypothetical protein